jgi:sugar (pentulose or hexulose) kinase
MTATNSVLPLTGNVSAGTSIFSMLVLDKPLDGVYPQIDVVTTPDGAPVAMVHCNNCCSELDAWVKVFGEFAELIGSPLDKSELYEKLYKNSLCGAPDCGGVTAYNFISGEPVADVEQGNPLCFRTSAGYGLANFFRAQIYSSMSALKIGMDILSEKENVKAELFSAHGGLFKVGGVAQQYLADGLNTPVAVVKTAGEGGAWGMALLAAYMICGGGRTLAEFLNGDVFAEMEKSVLSPDGEGVRGFNAYMSRYKAGLAAERTVGKI